MPPVFEGEKVARRFLDNTNNLTELSLAMKDFHDLDFEQKNRFLSYVAGAVQRFRQDLSLK